MHASCTLHTTARQPHLYICIIVGTCLEADMQLEHTEIVSVPVCQTALPD